MEEENKEFNFDAYYISAIKVLGEINIRSQKITPQAIAQSYKLLQEKIEEYNQLVHSAEIEIKLRVLNDRIRIKQDLEKRFRENKRLIKEKLRDLGIEVKPGSELSKLLRLDYLPHAEEDEISPSALKNRF